MSDSIDSDPFVHDQNSIGRVAQTVDEEHAALQACLNNFWAGAAIDTLVRLPNGWDMVPRASAVTGLRRGRRPTSSRRVAVVVRGTHRGGATPSKSRAAAPTTRSAESPKKATAPARKAAPKKNAKKNANSGKRGPKQASRPKRG